MSLSVGINSNVVLSKASYNEKGFSLWFKKKENNSALAAMMGGVQVGVDSNKETFIPIWTIKTSSYNGDALSGEEVFTEAVKYLNFARHLLSFYYDENTIAEAMSLEVLFKGVDISKVASAEDRDKLFEKESNVEKWMDNYYKAFEKLVNDANTADTALRVKTIRSKEDSNFPTLSLKGKFTNFVGSNRLFESMEVPEEASELKYSNYEKGLRLVRDAEGQPVLDEEGNKTYEKTSYDMSVAASAETPSQENLNQQKKDMAEVFGSDNSSLV